MNDRWRGLLDRVEAWFGVDVGWERVPADPAGMRRVDTWIALGFLVSGALGVELLRSLDALDHHPYLLPHVLVATGTVPLVWRRRWPLAVAAGLSLQMFVTGITMPAVMASVPMQACSFFALFTSVAWARDRRATIGVVVAVVALMFGWLTWQFAVGSGIDELLTRGGHLIPRQGLFSPVAAYVVHSLLINVFYFGGAIVGGQMAWRAALSRERLAAQARIIDEQAVSLQRQAVVEERLRIARELAVARREGRRQLDHCSGTGAAVRSGGPGCRLVHAVVDHAAGAVDGGRVVRPVLRRRLLRPGLPLRGRRCARVTHRGPPVDDRTDDDRPHDRLRHEHRPLGHGPHDRVVRADRLGRRDAGADPLR